jgi:hypothetical protein
MSSKFLGRAALGACAALVMLGAAPALAQSEPVEGTFALPGVAQAVTGQLNMVETGPLSRRIELTYADRETGKQIAAFDVELTQQLHILATDAGLTHLIHEHADEVQADGRFVAELEFPAPGLYHIYTDAVPSGIGQQVMRFDVTVGDATPAPQSAAAADIAAGPLVSSDGAYSVSLDASQLQAGVESAVSLLVEKNGAPASDLEPYLGVSAHAVFIRVEDLAYVHAHATQAGAGGGHGGHGSDPIGSSQPADHSHGGAAESAAHGGHGAHGQDHGHQAPEVAPQTGSAQGGPDTAPTAAVNPDMSLHVTPPAPGTYALWIEFIGGGEIRTVPFKIEIPEAHSHASY